MEEDITDAIYGDLEDFEFEEKLKERNEEITSLTERLNQSLVTITDLQNQIKNLKKENRQLQKNSSSLLLTAKLEVSRKQRDISALNERIDNRTFRRPNRNAVAIQTDLTIPPLVNVNVNNNNVTFTELMKEQIVEPCTKTSIETVEKSIPTNNNRNGSNTYRIPKKNPFARNMDIDESKNAVSVCNTVKLENSQVIANDQQKRYHLPKKNPHARRLDVHEEKPDGNKVGRYENDVDKGRSSKRDDDRDNNRRSTSARNRDSKKSCSSDDQRRYRNNSRSRRKHSRGRSSSDERDRHSKRFRSNSKPNRHRSRSTSYNEEKHRQPKSPKKNSSKSRKDDRSEEAIPQHHSISSMKDRDLEAMLIAQKKILEEIDSQDNKEERVKENTSKERRKQKLSANEDVSGKVTNPVRSDDTFNSANEAISSVPLSSESKDSPSMVEKNSVVAVNNINEVDSVPEITIPSNCLNEVPVEPVALFPIIKLQSLTPLKNISSPAKELMDERDEVIIPSAASQFECNENSNSQMDIDYELMERTSAGSQSTGQEINKDLEEQGSTTTTSPSKEKCSDSLFAELSASIIAVDGSVTSDGENILNRSSERHIVSKSCEYTVQDVGDEVVIFLTKKRKKNKKLKPIS